MIRHPAVAALTTDPGVYRFRDARGRVLYIGRAVNLRRRVSSYWGALQGRRHLRRMIPQIDRVEALTCDSEHEAAWLERNLLERTLPRWNRTAGGQEVPVYIRLDRRRGSAGLTVVHEPDHDHLTGTSTFGPYLGGARVRTAVTALHRVLPLSYTGDRLTGAEREMARIRGVAHQDREALVRTLENVLARDPVAIETLRADLTHRRDVASAALAFEFAARIHEEIEAIDWIVAPQKVTLRGTVTPPVIAGWADGLLVEFEVRAGRLDGWRQRACSLPTARERLGRTPPEWTDFATRNAALAARLLRSQNSA